jgi:signal transduction histidine kinase
VLNNLIRNAYQYTHEGWIRCQADAQCVVIENCDTGLDREQESISFGLGLELTQQICTKLGWQLQVSEREGGLIAWLTLPG